MNWLSRHRTILGWCFVALFFAAVVLALASTPSFKACHADRERASDGSFSVIETFLRCEAVSTDSNNAVVTALATFVIACFTFTLWRTNSKQLRHNREVDRAYLVGGGDCAHDAQGRLIRDPAGQRLFRVEVGNHGQTPAFLYEFEIEFCTQIAATGQTRPNLPRRIHNDQFPPGERHRPIGPLIPIVRSHDDVVFGTFYYRDIWGDEHYSRFILRIDAAGHTHSDMRGVGSYRGST